MRPKKETKVEPKKRSQYSKEALFKAIQAILGGMPASTASKLFKVPRATLQDKIKGRTPLEKKPGPETILSKEEETLLVNWLLGISDCGFSPSKTQLLDSVELLVKALKRPNNFKNGRPGRKWYDLFLKRHPELKTRISQNLECSTASLSEWFKEVRSYLELKSDFEGTLNAIEMLSGHETKNNTENLTLESRKGPQPTSKPLEES